MFRWNGWQNIMPGGMITVGSILLDEKYDDEECRKKLAAFYRYILIRK